MLGRISSFINDLHLSYDDVVYKIPFRNLVIMQRDIQHEATGDVVHYKTGAELAASRK